MQQQIWSASEWSRISTGATNGADAELEADDEVEEEDQDEEVVVEKGA